jgi:hypothetical protein
MVVLYPVHLLLNQLVEALFCFARMLHALPDWKMHAAAADDAVASEHMQLFNACVALLLYALPSKEINPFDHVTAVPHAVC